MKKRILALILTGAMAASLIACGNGTDASADGANGEQAGDTETEEVLAQALGSQMKASHSSESGKEGGSYR